MCVSLTLASHESTLLTKVVIAVDSPALRNSKFKKVDFYGRNYAFFFFLFYKYDFFSFSGTPERKYFWNDFKTAFYTTINILWLNI